MTAVLAYHKYKYYPYEKALALREINQILGIRKLKEDDIGVKIANLEFPSQAERLVYFAKIQNGASNFDTLQSRLEQATNVGKNRQSTRYSVHGLHEYKGKFNPQIVKAILNIFGIQAGQNILDPFCGSGTTLIECAHLDANGFGYDINPFAVYIANAKLQALNTPAAELIKCISKIRNYKKRKILNNPSTERLKYLSGWFDLAILEEIESIRLQIETQSGENSNIFLAIASNLLRDYSLQDPKDLRIRRRKSPLPDKPFSEAFFTACESFIGRLCEAQKVIGVKPLLGSAVLKSVTDSCPKKSLQYDAAITSPPYAMALPYIDTQRLSLAWLNLIAPSSILKLESSLIGSREFRGNNKSKLKNQIINNELSIPENQHLYCLNLSKNLNDKDGFRRQAVPILLYRYFADMRDSFKSVYAQLKTGAPYALVVGHNHTTLGGIKFNINTPVHLAELAKSVGWEIEELIPLQTYKRYGYHSDNAVTAETLIILRK